MRLAHVVGLMLILAALGPIPRAGAAAPDRPTFTEDVAPLLFANCTTCHRPGEAAPFPLLSYNDARKRGALLSEVVARREMPPWKPAAGWGHFQDERRLADDQVATLARWVEAGMPEGPAERMPKPPEFPAGGWSLGTPDLVVTLPEAIEVPAAGRDIYRMVPLDLKLGSDRWVTAVEIRPTARSVVHHALFFLDNTGAARKLDAADPGPGFGRMGFPRTGSLGGWALGATPRHLPQGLAYPLAKGSDLVVQLHLHPSGKVEHERTSIGLYFAREAPTKKLLGVQAPTAFGFGTELRTRGIRPGEADFAIRGEWKAPFDVDLVAVGGHAHYLCTSMKAVAELPDGSERRLFAIGDWDFNWQGRYNYAEPVRLPKGSIVRTTLTYDNSASNPANPSDPPVHVRWGEGTDDEMGSVLFSFVAADEADAAGFRGPASLGGGTALADLTPERVDALFDLLDADRDGKLRGDEVPPRLEPFRGRLDANGDGALSRAEVGKLATFGAIGRRLRGGAPGRAAGPKE